MNFLNFSKSSILLEEKPDPVSECLNCLQYFTEFENPDADAAEGWVINAAMTELYKGHTKAEQFPENLQGLWCCDQLKKGGEDAAAECVTSGFCEAKCPAEVLDSKEFQDTFIDICKDYK